MTDESWRPVLRWEDFYEVSSRGNVRSVDRTVQDSRGRTLRLMGRLMVLSQHPSGHLYVRLCRDGKPVTVKVHHLVLESFTGPRPDGSESLHGNGDPTLNEPLNLRWGTRSENNRDAVRHGTHVQARKSACPLEHYLVSPNLVRCKASSGHRNCLACSRARAGLQYARRKGWPFDLRAEADRHYKLIMDGAGLRDMARTCPK